MEDMTKEVEGFMSNRTRRFSLPIAQDWSNGRYLDGPSQLGLLLLFGFSKGFGWRFACTARADSAELVPLPGIQNNAWNKRERRKEKKERYQIQLQHFENVVQDAGPLSTPTPTALQ